MLSLIIDILVNGLPRCHSVRVSELMSSLDQKLVWFVNIWEWFLFNKYVSIYYARGLGPTSKLRFVIIYFYNQSKANRQDKQNQGLRKSCPHAHHCDSFIPRSTTVTTNTHSCDTRKVPGKLKLSWKPKQSSTCIEVLNSDIRELITITIFIAELPPGSLPNLVT